MEINNNLPLNNYKINDKAKISSESDLKHIDLSLKPNNLFSIETNDILKSDIKFSDKSIQSYKFVDSEKPKENDIIKANYDKDKKIATISSDLENLSTKTIYNENSKLISSEIISKSNDSNLKFTTDFNSQEVEFKKLGIESKDTNKTIKALYDPKAKNLKSEVNTKFGDDNIKFNSEYNFDNNGSKLGADYLTKDYKVSTEYDTESNDSKIGFEYKKESLKFKSNFDSINNNKNLGLNIQHDDLEISTHFDGKKGYSLSNIQASKSVKLSEALPTTKFSVDYDNQKNTFKKVGVDLDTKLTKDLSVTFSSNLASSSKQHAVKINYDVYTNTKVSLEANTNGVDKDKSGYKISFSSSFKF